MSEEIKKAESLVEMFQSVVINKEADLYLVGKFGMNKKEAIQCAKLCVQEIIESWSEDDGLHFGLIANWWRGVLTELNKM